MECAKNFNLAWEYEDIVIIMLVERIDDMKLPYQIFTDKFQALLERVLEQPCVKKLLSQTVDSDNGEFFYGGIRFKNFQRGKYSVKNNVVLYVSLFVFKRVFW